MKKIFLISLLFVTTNAIAASATNWWDQPTICRLNPAQCYPSMGAGYAADKWDDTANCWGVKWICGEAFNNPSNVPLMLTRRAIQNGGEINSDYDVNILNGDCFGVRKTSTDGSMALVNGQMTKVWCPGILEERDIEETIEHGDVAKLSHEPSCQELATLGYVDVLNGKCYGKLYSEPTYYIQCNQGVPTLIVLNGANYIPNYTANSNNDPYPASQEEATSRLNAMYQRVHRQ